MLFELIAVIVAGFAGAGVALIANKLLRGRLPRWIMPVAAGAAMLATAIANEYGWYPRTVESLPDGLAIAETVEERAVYRPWTFLRPFVTRFLALDLGGMRTHDAAPEQRIVDIYAFARWEPPRKRTVAVDCGAGARADLADGLSFGSRGEIREARWRTVGVDDPIVRTACARR